MEWLKKLSQAIDYIRRRRMTKAAFELQVSKSTVMDIGLKYGYSSPTSFNRAFQNIHGVAPTAARRSGTILNSYPPISFSIKVTGSESMKYRIETKDPIRIVGIRTKLQEDQEQNFQIVPKFWDETLNNNLVSEISRLTSQPPYGILGVTVYKKPKDIYYYIATATDAPVPKLKILTPLEQQLWIIKGLFTEHQKCFLTCLKQ